MQNDTQPQPRDTRHSLPMALLRAREAVMSRFRPLLAEHDINEQQWRVIRVLGEAGTLDASEVAERTFILAPSLTRMIKTLEERLDPARFVRVHRSSIVRLDQVAELQPLTNRDAVLRLHDGTPVRVSRTYIDALLVALHARA